MTDRPVVPVILSGGAGSRLWPASRSRTPKQLLPLVDKRTMFAMTVQRTEPLAAADAPLVVCNEDQRLGIQRELAKLGRDDAALILEPIGRNTAPAAAAAALHLTADGTDPILFVMPADHVIRNEDAFAEAVALASDFADKGYLLTFGIDPTGPETGYGYIRFGDRLADGVRSVEEFREKPDGATAEAYVASGRYLWNSGMFMFRASRFLTELESHAPDVLAAVQRAIDDAGRDGNVVRLNTEAFAAAPSISIDYAVMEHTASAAVVPIHTGWSDVGSWTALWELGQHDDQGNVVIGDVELVDVQNSYVRSDGRLVAAIGLDNVVVVDTADATLVVRRDRSQDVKIVVDRLKAEGRPEVDTDGSEDRAWGGFTTLASAPGVEVAHLHVEPAAALPESTHDRRSVRWIVTEGTANVRVGDTTSLVPIGSSASAPAGIKHQVANASESDVLKMIEIAVDMGVEGDTRRD
ncbi:MAG: mannose-1-phosphate guanylyltransferase/mannose-6-phosphate isomerase [Acidimicrobiia bacterium]|jgi:mannose-1-phosphate guanylyltransferase/mannose-6-phosphate isomerase